MYSNQDHHVISITYTKELLALTICLNGSIGSHHNIKFLLLMFDESSLDALYIRITHIHVPTSSNFIEGQNSLFLFLLKSR